MTQGKEPTELATKYHAEISETSSIADDEFGKIFGNENNEEAKNLEGGENKLSVLKYVKALPAQNSTDADRARKSPDYPVFMKTFDDKYGKDVPTAKEIEKITRKLDTHYHVLAGHNKEVDKKDCDLMLYRNKIMKDLSDVMNDLHEAYNIITILAADRTKLQDLFAIFMVQIKGLRELIRNFEDDMAMYFYYPQAGFTNYLIVVIRNLLRPRLRSTHLTRNAKK